MKFRKTWNVFTTVFIALLLVLVILLAGMRLFGFQTFTVLSGSMSPAYPMGSLIYVKNVDCDTLQKGDVISFYLDEDTVATHRIVGIEADPGHPGRHRFTTKGDANESPDGGPVSEKRVIGKVVFSVPYLGFVSEFLHNPRGRYLAVAVGALIVLLLFIPEFFAAFGKKSRDG